MSYKTLLIAIILSLSSGIAHGSSSPAQKRYLKHIERVTQGSSEAPRRVLPIKSKRVSSSRGIIELNFDEMVPDSICTSMMAAKDLWESALSFSVPVYFDVIFEALDDDIAYITEIGYDTDNRETYDLPLALASQKNGKSTYEEGSPDGLIVFNSEIKWNCDFADYNSTGYNALTASLRALAICLGFGSSVIEDYNKPGDYCFWNIGPSGFDHLLSSGNINLSSLSSNTPELKNFVTSDNVSLRTSSSNYKVYAPKKFEPYKSLTYLNEKSSLMYYSVGNGSIIHVIDDATIDILKTLGWKTRVIQNKILGDDIDKSGIGSAYKSHNFRLENTSSISSYNWSFALKDRTGSYVEIQSGNAAKFTIDKIARPDMFYVNLNGDLEGRIDCDYTMNGKTYSAQTFYVSLELKPIIWSIESVKKIWDGHRFSIACTVNYTGADHIYADVEEEFSSSVLTHRFDEPFIAHITAGKMSSYYYSWVTFTVTNQYGSAYETLEFEPAGLYPKSKLDLHTIDADKFETMKVEESQSEIMLYSLDEHLVYKGNASAVSSANIPKGIYVKKTAGLPQETTKVIIR